MSYRASRFALVAHSSGPASASAGRVPFGLRKDILRTESEFLRFDDADNLAVKAQGVIGGSGLGRVFLDGTAAICGQRLTGRKGDDFPACIFELAVDQLFTGEPFRLGWSRLGHRHAGELLGLNGNIIRRPGRRHDDA